MLALHSCGEGFAVLAGILHINAADLQIGPTVFPFQHLSNHRLYYICTPASVYVSYILDRILSTPQIVQLDRGKVPVTANSPSLCTENKPHPSKSTSSNDPIISKDGKFRIHPLAAPIF